MADKEPTNSNYLMQERKSVTKPFSVDLDNVGGRSVEEAFNKYPQFKATDGLHKKCIVYATAYTETMLTRAKVEDPEIFAVKGMSKQEMQQHLINNMCLPYAKLNANQYRRTYAEMKEKAYT